MAGTLGSLVIDIGADVARLRADMSKAEKTVSGAMNSIKNSAKTAAIALTSIVSVGAFVALTRSALDTADAIGKLSAVSGLSIKRIQEFRFAADQTGVSLREADAAMLKFGKRVGLAKDGFGAAARAYKRLGIDLNQTTDQVFTEAVNAISNLKDATERGALATELFGDEAVKLGLTFKDGIAGINEFGEKARALGLVLSDDLVNGAEAANDQLSIMRQVLSAQFTRVLVELAPTITRIGEAFAQTAIKANAFLDAMKSIGEQSKTTLKNTIKILQSEYAALQAELDDVIAKQSGAKGPDGIIELVFGLRDPSEIRAEMAKVESEFKQAIERLSKLNTLPPSTSTKGGVLKLPAPPKVNRPTRTTKTGDNPAEEARKMIEALREQQAQLGMTAEQMKAYDITVLAAKVSNEKLRGELLAVSDAFFEASKQNELEQEALRLRESLKKPYQEAFDSLERYDLLLEKNLITASEWGEATNRALDEASKSFEDIDKAAEKSADNLLEAFKDMGYQIESAITNAVGASSLKLENLASLAESILESIFRNIVQTQVAQPISKLITGFTSGLFEPRAIGGPVSAGQSYVVGERGPEVFTPGAAGLITPNNQIGGGTVNVYVNPPPGGNPEAYRLSARQGALEGSRLLNRARAIS